MSLNVLPTAIRGAVLSADDRGRDHLAQQWANNIVVLASAKHGTVALCFWCWHDAGYCNLTGGGPICDEIREHDAARVAILNAPTIHIGGPR